MEKWIKFHLIRLIQ